MIIVITGPTGVGKTRLSLSLAKKLNAEIINGDSIQIYKGLDIGSAKVPPSERENIPHHLFDIKEVTEPYSIYDYQHDTREKIAEITKKGKNVIIVGGTGLYIKSALFDYTLSEEDNNDEEYNDIPTEKLYQELLSLDNNTNIDKHNRRRIIRALNYYHHTGKSISDNNQGNKLLYDAIFIGLTIENREELYERINSRVDAMIKLGLVEEAKSFYDAHIMTKPLLQGIGYKELYKYFANEISYDEAISLIKRNSRRYAKRQYTFFNHQFKMNWFNIDIHDFDKTIEEIYNYIRKIK